MSNESGPWGSRDPQPEPKATVRVRRGPVWPWALLVLGLGGLVLGLTRVFPEAMRTRDDWGDVAYYTGFAAIVAAGLLRMGRGSIAQHLRNAAIWLAIVGVLAVGIAYRHELARIPQRLQVAFSGGNPVATGEHELAIPQDRNGGYVIVGLVDGQRVRFVIDTGATETVLSPDDARRLGVDVDNLDFEKTAETANGLGRGAAWAGRIEVGQIAFDDFPMVINQAPMSTSLLGMSFLNRLESFQVRDGQLVLHWRDAPPPGPKV